MSHLEGIYRLSPSWWPQLLSCTPVDYRSRRGAAPSQGHASLGLGFWVDIPDPLEEEENEVS